MFFGGMFVFATSLIVTVRQVEKKRKQNGKNNNDLPIFQGGTILQA
jgi:hypothetical protein